MTPKKKLNLVYSTRADAELATGKAKKPTQKSLLPQQQTIRLRLDKKRRRGKTVTLASGFQLSPKDLKSLTKLLKQNCGAGGTAKADEIEIQGDHRDKIRQKLLTLHYNVK